MDTQHLVQLFETYTLGCHGADRQMLHQECFSEGNWQPLIKHAISSSLSMLKVLERVMKHSFIKRSKYFPRVKGYSLSSLKNMEVVNILTSHPICCSAGLCICMLPLLLLLLSYPDLKDKIYKCDYHFIAILTLLQNKHDFIFEYIMLRRH